MDAEIIAKKVVKVSFVIQQFVKMSPEQKSEYLGLHDAFQYISTKNENFALDLEAISVLSRKNDFQMSQEQAAKIWGIFNTNNFENGVYHSLSRVNHSCEPNSEFVWNNELQTQDLRFDKIASKNRTYFLKLKRILLLNFKMYFQSLEEDMCG